MPGGVIVRPPNCRRCDLPMVTWASQRYDGAVVHAGRGVCVNCCYASKCDGSWADYARLTKPWADTLDDYKCLAGSGLAEDQIATRIGLRPTILRQTVKRASKPRAIRGPVKKLTDDDIHAAYQKRLTGALWRVIAAQFGVSIACLTRRVREHCAAVGEDYPGRLVR